MPKIREWLPTTEGKKSLHTCKKGSERIEMQSFPREEIHCKGMMERTKKIDGVTNY